MSPSPAIDLEGAEVKDLPPVLPEGASVEASTLWPRIAEASTLAASDADRLAIVKPLLATLEQHAGPARELAPPDLASLCGGYPGAFKRIPLGLPGIDEALGGGLQTSRLLVIGGAPGANKTGLLASLAYRWAKVGVYAMGQHQEVLVVIFATDEPRHGFLSRIGQMEGVSRADLDSEDTSISGAAWAHVSSCVADVAKNLWIFDSRDEAVALEDVVELAAKHANGRRVVVLVDSLHSAPFRSDSERYDGTRNKIEARVKACVNLISKHRVCLVATSELNRGSYRSKNRDEQSADLAGFKESSGIEYGADVALLMRRVTEDTTGRTVEITIAKSRMGDADLSFTLTRTARFEWSEVSQGHPTHEDASTGPGTSSPGLAASEAEQRVLAAVVAHPAQLRSANDVAKVTRGRRGDTIAIVKTLVASGRIASRNGFMIVSGLTDSESAGTGTQQYPEPVPQLTRVVPGTPYYVGGVPVPPRSSEVGTATGTSGGEGGEMDRIRRVITETLADYPGVGGLDALRMYAPGLASWKAWEVKAAWAEMIARAEVVNRGTKRLAVWHIADTVKLE